MIAIPALFIYAEGHHAHITAKITLFSAFERPPRVDIEFLQRLPSIFWLSALPFANNTVTPSFKSDLGVFNTLRDAFKWMRWPF